LKTRKRWGVRGGEASKHPESGKTTKYSTRAQEDRGRSRRGKGGEKTIGERVAKKENGIPLDHGGEYNYQGPEKREKQHL